MAGRFHHRSRGKRTRYVVHNTYMWFRICFMTYWSVTIVCFLVTVKCRIFMYFFVCHYGFGHDCGIVMNCNVLFLFFVKKWLNFRQVCELQYFPLHRIIVCLPSAPRAMRWRRSLCSKLESSHLCLRWSLRCPSAARNSSLTVWQRGASACPCLSSPFAPLPWIATAQPTRVLAVSFDLVSFSGQSVT